MQEQMLGDYKILKTIGHGSMGTTLLAEHRFIKKLFVLKILPEELVSDKNFIQRFEEEVIRLSRLEHPHLVKIHTVSFADGVYFLVTDCILDPIGESTNLAQYMASRKERLREEELIHVLRQIAEAVDYAHGQGIVHRTLKLNNLLIGKGKIGIEIFVSDFGLSKIIGAGAVLARTFKVLTETLGGLSVEKSSKSSDDKYNPLPIEGQKLTKMTQSFLQNYAFFAPEQKRTEIVGQAADVYAFGVLAFFLITGHFPEGIFSMPSKMAPEYQKDWDTLITDCLQFQAEKRPKLLVPYFEESLRAEKVQAPQVKIAIPLRINPEEQKREKPTLESITATQPIKIEENIIEEKQELLVAVAASSQSVVEEVSSIKESQPYVVKEPAYNSSVNTAPISRETVKQYHPEIKQKASIEPILTEMVVIQGGQFLRGSSNGNRDEMPQHRIHIGTFAMDIHPVTNEHFVRFLEYMGSEKDANYNDLIRLKDSRLSRAAGKLSIEPGYSKHPVVGVTWYGAIAYSAWVGKRLPTEAEWEIAARGGRENAIYPFGDVLEKSHANFFSSDTTPVMTYPSNGYGLFDMAGNVYEWCQDWYGYNYYETSAVEPHDPKGPLQGVYRVLRGGCWKSLKEDLRCSQRHRNNPNTVNGTYGFRCAADI